jgi:hypothetical protein
MPIKRRKAIARHPSELLPIEWAYLRDDPEPSDAEFGAWWSLCRDDDAFRPGRPSVAQMWRELGAQIVQEHVKEWPGSRPKCWWKHNAPEPRRRVGGVGEPGRKDLSYGRPYSWSWPTVWPAGAVIIGGPLEADPKNPPKFESEATYLRRLGLLLPGEAERLTPADFEAEAIGP